MPDINSDSRYLSLLDEAHKRLETMAFLYVSFIFLAFVISFSKALQKKSFFVLPVLNIEMNKWNSVEVLVLLACAALVLAGIDLLLTNTKEWFVFEVNPSPAFSAFEAMLDAPHISQSVVRYLTTNV